MGELFQDLHQMHDCIRLGAPINKDIHVCVCLLNPHACALKVPAASLPFDPLNAHINIGGNENPELGDTSAQNEPVGFKNLKPQTCSRREITLLQLTLIQKLCTKVQSQDTGVSSRHQYLEILQTLLRQEKADCQLIFLLGSSDKLLSHLAAKCLSCLVLFLLKEENEVNSSWLLFCLKTMSDFPKRSAVSACIWSLTTVIKDFLDDPCLHSSESMKKLLTSLDAVFEGFYTSILPPYSSSKDQSASLNPEREAHLSVFLDLLEVLVVSRLTLKSHFSCQRVFFLYTSHALTLLSSPVHYYIVKKLVLLLKKVMLWTAGEHFVDVPVASSPFVQDPYLKADLLLLCNDILQVVNFGELQRIPVSDGASYFGGTDICSEDARQTGPDLVQLGALSLILLKALETKVKAESSDERLMQGEFESFMSQLLEFLKSHLDSQHFVHSCEWVSLIFIEQDDDMLEAAKALLTVYVKSERIWRRSINTLSIGKVFPNWTHDAGCNPHCIFLHLLKNVGFDDTVLLDFLISSETCFLEYIVRYLKFLREDWTEFCQVCNFIDTFTSKECATVCEVVTSIQQDCVSSQVGLGVFNGLDSTEKAHFLSAQCPFEVLRTSGVAQQTLACKSNSSTRTDHLCGLGTLRGLVDYDSSDDSEENTASDPQQNCIGHQSSAGICNDLGAELDRLDLKSTTVNPQGCSTTSAHEDAHTTLESTMLKSTQCLAELQAAISRLKRRNLFPYNPSALLKLLIHIETLQEHKSSVKHFK